MNREEFFYLLPYLFSFGLALAIFFYTWAHRHVRGARIYSWFMFGQILTLLGFILELVSPNLQTKLFWDKFQWLTDSFVAFIPFLIFATRFSEHKLWNPRLIWAYWISLPVLFTLLLFTDSLHHLVYPNPHLSADYPFPELQYDFTGVVYAYSVLYIYGANFYGIGLLIRRAVQPHNPYRRQYWAIAIGFMIPLVMSFFTLANIRIARQRDIAPFSFAVGNLIVAWGLFRFRLFDIVPIARERIIENMSDPVIILDARNRVVDANPAALKTLRKQFREISGRPSSEVFAKWPIIAGELEYLDTERREMVIEEGGDTFYYDVNISSIYNNQQQMIGRIVAARDITRYKTLESGYRLLSEELEQRVRARTEELRRSAEQYRAVVENQTEFIVRWRPDGTRSFVNEAYCRYFGITAEQALLGDFLPLIVEEDRPAVGEKIARLSSGRVEVETDVHRVTRPDGSIGWQEWTDQAIRDETGRLIEFQSVGRDITENKRAEATILKQLAFESFMTRLLSQFATCSFAEVDASIVAALQEIAEFLGGDFADILLLSEDKKSWNSTHFWIDPKIATSIHPIQTFQAGTLAWSEKTIFSGRSIKINSLDDYPPEAILDRQFGEARGLKSLLSVPIRGREQSVFGAIDMASYSRQVIWADVDVTHLKLIGDAIANLIERKKAEDALRESEERFAILSSATFEAIGLSEQKKIIDVNEQMLTMFGYVRDEMIGMDVSQIIAPESIDLVAHRRASGLEDLYEHLSVKKDGTVFPVEVRPRTIPYKGQPVRVTAIRDITERKKAEADLAEAYDTTLEGWARALELRDKETEGHSRRVTEATVAVAREMGFDEEAIVHIRRGSILHDIGKMGIPDHILRKNGPLTDAERNIVQKHPTTAFDLLKPIAYLEKALEIPYSHHEKWDGTGYPRGLKGEEIPLAARIFAVVDVWDALISERPYREAWPREKVKQYLIADSGKHFDPKVLDVFLQMTEKGEI